MAVNSAPVLPGQKAPWHLWAVGMLSLLWNGSGAATIMLAQAGQLPGITPEEAAYYAAQPAWFVIVTDIALLAAIAGAVALLLRSRFAVALFSISLAAVLVSNLYDLAAGTSRVLVSQGALIVTLIIAVIAVLQLLYAWRMSRRAILR